MYVTPTVNVMCAYIIMFTDGDVSEMFQSFFADSERGEKCTDLTMMLFFYFILKRLFRVVGGIIAPIFTQERMVS